MLPKGLKSHTMKESIEGNARDIAKESKSRHKHAKIKRMACKHKSRVITANKVPGSCKLSKRQLYKHPMFVGNTKSGYASGASGGWAGRR